MGRPETGFAAARLYRWQTLPISQPFLNEFGLEPLSRRVGSLLYPPDHPTGELGHFHRGVDISCPVGTPVRLVLGGVVSVPPFDGAGFGNAVQCDGARYRMTYGHLSVIRAMPGQRQFHGDLVALTGSTGNSTGPHIHFELFDRQLGAWIDPWQAV